MPKKQSRIRYLPSFKVFVLNHASDGNLALKKPVHRTSVVAKTFGI